MRYKSNNIGSSKKDSIKFINDIVGGIYKIVYSHIKGHTEDQIQYEQLWKIRFLNIALIEMINILIAGKVFNHQNMFH